jgi:N-methylhydantoinase B
VSAVATTTSEPTLLRDLTKERFEELYDTDRFTATVLANRLRFVVQHVATGLLHRAFSPIIALAMDFAGAICGPPEQDYRIVAVTNGLTIFLGTLQDGIRAAVEEYGLERLVPGDLLLCNDPVRMGNHPNDVAFIRPVFHEGAIVGFMVIRAHMMDVGGITPGGFSTTMRNTYEGGLVITPRLLFHAEEPVRETFSLIFDNSRFGQVQLPDYKTIQSCCRLGDSLISESIGRYGVAAYLGTLRYSCDNTAERMRAAFGRLPDGDYEGEASVDADAVDASEEYVVRLKLIKRGTRVEVDLSGSARQARTSINAGALDAKSAIGVGLKNLLDPEGHFTSGMYADVDIVIPPGTIASALPPDGPTFYYWEVEHAIMAALIIALRGALGEDAVGGDCGSNNTHNAYGTLADGTPWACSSLAGAETGPIGADRWTDGEGHAAPYLINIISPSTEALEADFPLMIMRKEYVADTGGAGVNRGGAAILKDIMWTAPAEHQAGPLRFRHPSGVGVAGAADGAAGGVWIFNQQGHHIGGPSTFVPEQDDAYASATPIAGMMESRSHVLSPAGEFAYYGRQRYWATGVGATWRYVTNAGGGWGDPLAREPERVMRDVRDGYVTLEGVLRDYGVVIHGDPEKDPEGLRLDSEATANERERLAARVPTSAGRAASDQATRSHP